ncbi:protein of unknown function [Cupriavidus taiwanensis]|nr:protein of unknown function [Cupriavidus taiwanensis]
MRRAQRSRRGVEPQRRADRARLAPHGAADGPVDGGVEAAGGTQRGQHRAHAPGVVAHRRRHRADAGQVGVAHPGAVVGLHRAAQRADRVGGIELRQPRRAGGRKLIPGLRLYALLIEQPQEHAPGGGPQQRHHRARAHVHRHRQARFLEAHDGRSLVAHHRDEAGHLQGFAQAHQRGLGQPDRVGLAHRRHADLQRLEAKVVLLRARLLRHQAFFHQADQVAVHLGRAFVDMRGQRGQAGAPAEARQAFQDGHAGDGRLHALATFAGAGRGGFDDGFRGFGSGHGGTELRDLCGVHGDSGRCHTVTCGQLKVNPHSIITQCVYDLRKTEIAGPGPGPSFRRQKTCPAPALPPPCASLSAR